MGLLAAIAVRVGVIQLATNVATLVSAVNLSLSTIETAGRLVKQARESRAKKDAP